MRQFPHKILQVRTDLKNKNSRKKTEIFIPDMSSEGDAEGSYTGLPSKDCFGDRPVQDADDL